MSYPIQLIHTIQSVRNSLNRLPLRRGLLRKQPRKRSGPRTQTLWIIRGFLLITFTLASLVPLARARAEDGDLGNGNCAEGAGALSNLLIDGNPNNTAMGDNAFFNLGHGLAAFNNTAVGSNAGFNLYNGQDNTAVGYQAFYNNSGVGNTATGSGALFGNGGADNTDNTADGYQALYNAGVVATSNTAIGAYALFSEQGNDSTAVGYAALENDQVGENTAIGSHALNQNTVGMSNTASGVNALESNMDGSYNTATGSFSLSSNVSGNNNTAMGYHAMMSNTASDNTAFGYQALLLDDVGSGNTADGENALLNNTSGVNNTASGLSALQGTAGAATGSYNTATGGFALSVNSSGSNNTATGIAALGSNTTGGSNTGTGQDALLSNTTGNDNTAEGSEALKNNTSGSNNIALGVSAGSNLTTGSSNIDIGNPGVAGESFTIRIGGGRSTLKVIIFGINGHTVANGVPVLISPTTGQLGTTTSSARYKDNIQPMDKASEAILSLQPVTFRYKKELDPDGIPQFGLVAEQVEKVDPELVARNEEGKPYSVRYEAVNAMLLNEFLKEHRKVEEQEATISQLKSAVAKEETVAAQQQKQIMALIATMQKVSDKVEMSKAAPQMVADNQ